MTYLRTDRKESECMGCGADVGIEYIVTFDGLKETQLFELCGFCGDKVLRFIEKEL